MEPDYQHLGHSAFERGGDLAEFLHSHDETPIRILGLGTSQKTLPAPTHSPLLISLSGMNKVTRLDAEDLTCSVEPGISREEFDATLAAQGVMLPCEASSGSLGGLFAAGHLGPFAHGAMSPRSLLLGIECLLAEGMAFCTGARVVKNVAGYDLPKLYVGSRGTLFIATLLHLKLRAVPKCRRYFCAEDLDQIQATTLFTRLRLHAPSPSALLLRKSRDGLSIEGRMEGRSNASAQIPRGDNLREIDAFQNTMLSIDGSNQEVLAGAIRPSRLGAMLDLLPDDCELSCNGTGQFEIKGTLTTIDTLLGRIAALDGHAEIRLGCASRRGLATAIDPGHQKISAGLKQALDPKGVLQ